jgi:transcriptional regulator with XRE-family HTH domain
MENKEKFEAKRVVKAVRALRVALGDTQQSFAHRLGLAISTVVRYELTRPPRGIELGRFYHLAIEHHLTHIADVFARAMELELNMRGERIPRTIEESLVADVAFLVMRNRENVYGVDRDFAKVQDVLAASFRRIEESFLAGGPVVGIDEEGLEILKAELAASWLKDGREVTE